MKKILVRISAALLALLCAAAVLVACSNQPKGKYSRVKDDVTASMTFDGDKIIVEAKSADGKSDYFRREGTFRIEDGKLYINYDGHEYSFSYRKSGNKVVIGDQEYEKE